MSLHEMGWNEFYQSHFAPCAAEGLAAARVAGAYANLYTLWTADGEIAAEVSGKFRHNATESESFPAVGDWVAITLGSDRALIHTVLPRRTAFRRHAAGRRTGVQVVAANIDIVFLVSGLDGDFNLRRIERYLTVAWDSGAVPVIVLNKSDLCALLDDHIAATQAVAPGVDVIAVSGVAGAGVEQLRARVAPGKTAAFIGSSGVGKSTLINCLLGEARQRVHAVRADDQRGRHTTTHRELLLLERGGVLMDTPGMRELQFVGDEDGLARTFEDVEALAEHCRFRDCEHGTEPGCAVRAALEAGTLDGSRWESYAKQRKELAYQARRTDQRALQEEKRKWKGIAMEIRRHFKDKT